MQYKHERSEASTLELKVKLTSFFAFSDVQVICCLLEEEDSGSKSFENAPEKHNSVLESRVNDQPTQKTSRLSPETLENSFWIPDPHKRILIVLMSLNNSQHLQWILTSPRGYKKKEKSVTPVGARSCSVRRRFLANSLYGVGKSPRSIEINRS